MIAFFEEEASDEESAVLKNNVKAALTAVEKVSHKEQIGCQ